MNNYIKAIVRKFRNLNPFIARIEDSAPPCSIPKLMALLANINTDTKKEVQKTAEYTQQMHLNLLPI